MSFITFNSEEDLQAYLSRPVSEYSEYGKFDFEQCNFNFAVSFKRLIREFDELAFFKKCQFNKKASFEDISFRKAADFNGCTFFGQANFKHSKFYQEATFGVFDAFVNFKGTTFFSSTDFPNSFEKVDFSCCKFTEYLDLSERIFKQDLSIHDSEFLKEVSFESSEFQGKVNSWNTTFHDNLICRWADFRKKINLTESKITKGFADFYGTNFEANAYFYKTHFKKIDLKNSVIDKGVFFLDSKIDKGQRETFRIIKNQFLSQNNRVDALKAHQREMNSFTVETIQNIFIQKPSLNTFGNIANLLILVLNFISNGFGLWWFAGVSFLFVTTCLMFTWYLNYVQVPCSFEFWKYFPQFLNPTHKTEFIEGAFLETPAYFLDFFGRAVSSFGIYQTVQAFRKFGRL
jgi:uncharacterized protein YjbI with pentapeptide repeats